MEPLSLQCCSAGDASAASAASMVENPKRRPDQHSRRLQRDVPDREEASRQTAVLVVLCPNVGPTSFLETPCPNVGVERSLKTPCPNVGVERPDSKQGRRKKRRTARDRNTSTLNITRNNSSQHRSAQLRKLRWHGVQQDSLRSFFVIQQLPHQCTTPQFFTIYTFTPKSTKAISSLPRRTSPPYEASS